jgi:hypothetical protein
LPTDSALRGLSPFQSLWLYTHIKKEQAEDRKFFTDLIRTLSYMINPRAAKKVFDSTESERGVQRESVEMTEKDFISQIKKMDPTFDESGYKSITEGMR